LRTCSQAFDQVAAELLNKPGDRGPAGLFSGILVEQIAQLVGHSGTNVTELVYRHNIRPVIQTGATTMDRAIRTARLGCVVTQRPI
jgi:hypothetical protein